MQHIRPILESLGLNPKETELYLLLLQIGTAPASALARRMRIPSSTAQYTCQQLLKKGLIRMIQKRNLYLFSAESPKKLLSLVDHQRETLDEKEKSVTKIINELEDLINPDSVLPKVKFFEGRDGVVDAYLELLDDLKPNTEVISYLKPIDLEIDTHKVRSVFENIGQEFMKKKVPTRIILPYSELGIERYKNQDKYLEECRFIPEDSFDCYPTEILVYGNKMYCITGEQSNIFATILENQSIAAVQKASFELAWAQAKTFHDRMVAKLKS